MDTDNTPRPADADAQRPSSSITASAAPVRVRPALDLAAHVQARMGKPAERARLRYEHALLSR